MTALSVVDDIARSVVDRLKVSLAEVLRPLIDRHTDNARAYEHYLKGRFYWTRRWHGGLMASLEHFKKAIEEDAGYALAFAGLACAGLAAAGASGATSAVMPSSAPATVVRSFITTPP